MRPNEPFGLRLESKLNIVSRFLGAGPPKLARGRCVILAEGHSFFGVEWDKEISRIYTCTAAGQPEGAPPLEVQVPTLDNTAVKLGPFSISNDPDSNDPKTQACLGEKVRFVGSVYEARPTRFAASAFLGRRMVGGFTITRVGQPVGRIDFDKRNAGRSAIRAAVSDADGRQAVLFFALSTIGDAGHVHRHRARRNAA